MIDNSKIPNLPGCYLFKDKDNNIIYVGKAKDLKKRVNSYFQKQDHEPKTNSLIGQIDSIDFFVTNNEVEALILENNLIKKNNPKYNIDLKDSKRYALIELTNEVFPRILIARKRTSDSKYFGPFVSGEKRDYIISTFNRVFKLRTCKKLPKKPCLRHHIGVCDAPCIQNISKEKYSEKIKIIESILKGKTEEIIELLKEKMKEESEKMNFEAALELRNQIEAILWIKEKQTMERNKVYDEDIINFITKENKIYLLLFNIYKGTLENKQEFEFPINFNNRQDFLEEFLMQYYSENKIPKEIILPHSVDKSLKNFLEQRRKSRIIITTPKIGEKKILLSLVLKNLEINFFGDNEKLEYLKKEINLEALPKVIECFDISHLTGTSTVGSMVQFKNGKPDKSNYRRFKIKTVGYIDDFEGIREIVRRRYQRLKNEKQEFPDLIIIDGGKGQLSSALEVLKKLEIKIPVISIVKELEEIYTPEAKDPIRLDKKNKALQLVQEIRDEAHRFAIKYNRLLRKKEMLK